jgi:membrane-associated phospholipid phosphatase
MEHRNISLRPILLWAALCWLVLAGVVFFTPIAMTSVSDDSGWSSVAWLISESGGKYGTLAILLVTCFFYTRFVPGVWRKWVTFGGVLLRLVLVIGAFAWVNEYAIKKIASAPRPSHVFFMKQSDGQLDLASFYAMDAGQRTEVLKELIRVRPAQFDEINERVLRHWVEETGFGFPSGHSFNAFLLAAILAYSLRYSRSKTANRIYILPLVWATLVALSRVSMGAHTSWDVSFGALTGLILGALILHFDLLRRNLLHRDHEATSA